MKQLEIRWFLGESLLPWEASVAGSIARALIQNGTILHTYSASGIEAFNIPGLLSWRSMNALERGAAVLSQGRLWHLWGTPPSWWGLIRFRSRTVHTSFFPPEEWKGHPTVLTQRDASGGETYIPPVFEVKVNWGGSVEEDPSSKDEGLLCLYDGDGGLGEEYQSLVEAMGGTLRFLKNTRDEALTSIASGKAALILEVPTTSLALLAAKSALMGVATASPSTPVMDELLGKEGYVIFDPSDGGEDKKNLLKDLTGEKGRSASAAARRHASEVFTPEKSAKKLEGLYRFLSGGHK